jgi:D-alanyl-D-alanine carboxypeptidase
MDAGSTMRPHPRSVLLAAALIAPTAAFAACGGSDPAAPPAAAKAATPTAEPAAGTPATRVTLASRMRAEVAAGSPGVISLVNDGHGIELRAAGVADTGSRQLLRGTDRFRAGSNTKTFVSTVALQLVAEGKLKLSDTVGRWLPGILPYGDTVNLRQLLNMTSGIPDYVPELQAEMVGDTHSLTRTYAPRELVARVADTKPDFAAGTSWNYSSTGYVLAGLIIERATGHKLGDELEHRIFNPLQLRHTSLPLNTSAFNGRHSRGYGEVDGELHDLSAFNNSAAWAVGGLVTTAPDIARFWRALLGGELLAPAQLKAMKTTVPIGDGYPASYGLGIFKYSHLAKDCGPVWGHGGDLPGFSSEFLNSEDGKIQSGVIINVNPIPEAAARGTLGALKTAAIADALGREQC